jgi:hypothetical protein
MSLDQEAVRRNPYLRLVFGRTASLWPAFVRALVAAWLPASFVVGAAAIERTLFIDGPGKGVFEHIAFLGYVFTTPLVIFLTWMLLRRVSDIAAVIGAFSTEKTIPQPLENIIDFHRRVLTLRTYYTFLLGLGVVVGVGFTVLNARWVKNPVLHYGGSAFDAVDYPLGFYSTRIFLGLVAAVVYPVAIFLCLAVTWFLHEVLGYLCSSDTMRINFSHPDKCGGLSPFGALNLVIMEILFVILLQVFASIATHREHIQVQMFLLPSVSLLLALQSVGAVYSIHRCVRNKKDQAIKKISKTLGDYYEFGRNDDDVSLAADLLTIRTHIEQVKTYPYSSYVLALVNLLRFSPAVVAILNLWTMW